MLAVRMDETRKARRLPAAALAVVKSHLEHDDKAGLANAIELYQSHAAAPAHLGAVLPQRRVNAVVLLRGSARTADCL